MGPRERELGGATLTHIDQIQMKVYANLLPKNPTTVKPGLKSPDIPKAWRADWRMTLFVIVMLPLVLSLGAWQLERAAYKQGLMDAYFDKLGALPIEPEIEIDAEAGLAPFTRVRVRGKYLPMQLLLDNQIDNSKIGYWVYAPFTAAGATWLVNRGWVPAPRLRSNLPEVAALPVGEVSLVALVWPDTGTLPLFGEEAVQHISDSVMRVQRLDIEALEALLDIPLAGQELRLEAGQPGLLKAAPQTIGFGVERHQGYAFQWFGLALALVTLYYFYGRSDFGRKNGKQESKS